MVRILMLVLASDNEPCYVGFQAVWRRYMHTCPEIEAWMYKASLDLPGTDDVVVDEVSHTITVRVAEHLFSCHEKLVCVLRHFAPRFHEFDYLYRPNVSTFVLLRRYVRHARTWPRTNFYAGYIYTEFNITFASGASFTLSMDLAARYVSRAERVLPPALVERGVTSYMDDVAVGFFVETAPHHLPRVMQCTQTCPTGMSPKSTWDLSVPWDTHNIRVRTRDRAADVKRHEELYLRFYARPQYIKSAVPRVTVVSACIYVDDTTCTAADLIESTRDLLSANVYLVLFCSEALLPGLLKLRAEKMHMTVFVCVGLNQLWTAAYHDTVERYWPTCDARAGVWSHLITCNKFDWVSQVIQDDPFKTHVFAWVNNKLSKMMPPGGDGAFQLQRALSALQTLDAFYIQVMGVVDPELLVAAARAQFNAKSRHAVCSGLFALPASHSWVLNELKSAFVTTVEAGYGRSDEMLFPEVMLRTPAAFKHSFGDYCDMLTNCPVPRQNIPYILSHIIRPLRAANRHREAVVACDAVLSTLETWQELPASTAAHWQLYTEVLQERLFGPDGLRDEAIAAQLHTITCCEHPVDSACVSAGKDDESTVYDDFVFFPGLDYGGNDIACVGRLPVDALMKIANTMPRCIAFNTSGFMKHQKPGGGYDLNADAAFEHAGGVYIRRTAVFAAQIKSHNCAASADVEKHAHK